MSSVAVVDRSAKQTIKELSKIRKTAVPQAVRNTLNSLAFEGRKVAQKNISKNFINRNTYVRRRTVYRKTSERNIRNMTSYIGHLDRFMKYQEEGGYEREKNDTASIGTPSARSSGSFGKPVQKAFYLSRANSIPVSPDKSGTRDLFKAEKEGLLIYRFGGLYRFQRKIRRTPERKLIVKLKRIYTFQKRKPVQPRPFLRPAAKRVSKPSHVQSVFKKQAGRIIKSQ